MSRSFSRTSICVDHHERTGSASLFRLHWQLYAQRPHPTQSSSYLYRELGSLEIFPLCVSALECLRCTFEKIGIIDFGAYGGMGTASAHCRTVCRVTDPMTGCHRYAALLILCSPARKFHLPGRHDTGRLSPWSTIIGRGHPSRIPEHRRQQVA